MTFIVFVTPPPLTVIVPVRWASVVLLVAVTVIVPLFVPVAGATVSHVVALLTAVQLVLEVTVNDFASPV